MAEPNLEIVETSNGFEKMTGYSIDEIEGANFLEFLFSFTFGTNEDRAFEKVDPRITKSWRSRGQSSWPWGPK